MNGYLVKHLIYPMHELLRGRKTFSYLSELERSQWLSVHELRDLQLRKIKALLQHSYSNIPYYRHRFDEIGIRPEDIHDFDDFARLPFLTKKDVRENLHEMVATDARWGLKRYNTGGSTGEPLIFFIDRRRMAWDAAARFRSRLWWGVDIGDREVALWGSPVELCTQDKVKSFRDHITNSILLSAFNMTEQSMREYADIIRGFQPEHIFGYASSIYLFSKFLNRNGIDLRALKLRAIFTTAEVLYDHQRELIESTFGCPVADGYGGRDSGFISHECPEGGMHVTAENIYVEFIDGSFPVPTGERGEILITHLDAYGMPFIRYRTGDVSSALDATCPCGRGLPVMGRIDGRTTDFLVTKDGRIMHGLSLIYVIRNLEGVEQFKITQKSTEEVLIHIVKNEHFSPSNVKHISDEIHKIMGYETKVDINFPDYIPPEKSGKFRYVVSNIADRFFE